MSRAGCIGNRAAAATAKKIFAEATVAAANGGNSSGPQNERLKQK